jgi:hypothetical protein
MITVNYTGGIGNNLWQYSAARVFSLDHGLAFRAKPISNFNNLETSVGGKKAYFPREKVFGHYLPEFESGRHYIFKGHFERFEHFIGREAEVKNWCTPRVTTQDKPHKEDLVISIRRGWNNWPVETHCPSIEYYVNLLEKIEFRNLWICTDSPADTFFEEMSKHVNFKIYNGTAIDQYNFIMQSRRYLMAPSTFSFWAAWVGESREIFWPKIPALNFTDTDYNWRPATDARFVDI